MKAAPRWTVQRSATVLLVVMWCCSCVSRVQTFPCNRAVGGVQLPKVVCFITASNEHYDYESLRTGMCSHVLLIDLMGVGKDGSLELLQASSRSLSRFNRMKRRFRDIGDEAKFIISIGGVAQKSSHFSKALKTPESRHSLSDELISFNIKHGLDGIDIAWFYPAQFGGVESDRASLVVFLRDLYLRTKACDISLSLTVGVDPKDIELSYDMPRIDKMVDFVNLLTGDYHSPTDATHISPLYGQGPRDRLNINYSVMSYIEAGLNPRKIVILDSCYAYVYVSKITKENTTCTAKLRTVMRVSYLSARELIIRESFQTSWDDMRHVPYGSVTKGITKKWITYNDVESVRRKADYVLHYQLGGMGLFSVDEDDYGGRAGCGRYPMLRTIVEVLYPELACDESESEEDIETIVCPYSGYLADPVLPEYYYVCEQGVDLQQCPKQRCPQGETFDVAQRSCCQQLSQPSTPCNYIPGSQYTTIGPPQYVPPQVGYAQPPHGGQAYGPQPTGPQVPAYLPGPQPYLLSYSSPLSVTVGDPQGSYQQGPQLQTYSSPLTVTAGNPNSGPPYEPPPVAQPYINNLVDIYVGSSSTIAPSICDPVPEPSNPIPQVLITANSCNEPVQLASSNVAVQILETPKPPEEFVVITDTPPVLITPRQNYNRPSKKSSKSGRRKSRSRSHSDRTSTEGRVALETTITSLLSTTEPAPSAATSTTATQVTTSNKRVRARKTIANSSTTAPNSTPTSTTAVDPSTTTAAVASTEPPPTSTTSTPTVSTTVTSTETATTSARTSPSAETSTLSARTSPRATNSTYRSTGSSSSPSSSLSTTDVVTFADKTVTFSPSTSAPPTTKTTTTATSTTTVTSTAMTTTAPNTTANVTLPDDAASHLVTTVT